MYGVGHLFGLTPSVKIAMIYVLICCPYRRDAYMLKILAVVLISLCCTACGFHLRGALDVPELSRVYLQSSKPFGDFERLFKKRLTESAITVAGRAQDAPIILNIKNEETNASQVTIGSSQQTRVYRVSYAVSYELKNAKTAKELASLHASAFVDITLLADEQLENSAKFTAAKAQALDAVIDQIFFQLSSESVKKALSYHQ